METQLLRQIAVTNKQINRNKLSVSQTYNEKCSHVSLLFSDISRGSPFSVSLHLVQITSRKGHTDILFRGLLHACRLKQAGLGMH